jgi:hypothetical protein
MRNDRDLTRGLRVGFCSSEQERRNLETTTRCEKQKVRRYYHWFSLSAEL